jgi:serine kinase of HPr protein (carbohydrate metabolism regulator)
VILHAGLVTRRVAGYWRGVLIEGPSGSGKSDLALRALDIGWRLVADDRTRVWVSGGRLFGRAGPNLAGLIEARGVGVVGAASRDVCAIDLAALCGPADAVERAPEFQAREILGVAIPQLRLVAHEASAPAKLAYALSLLGLRSQPAYQTCRAGLAWPTAGGDP